MQIAVTTRSLWEMPLPRACAQLQDLGFDKVELCINDAFDQLSVADVVSDSESVIAELHDSSRVSPVAIFLEQEVGVHEFAVIADFAKQLRVAQLTLEASPVGTPFNTEIDRLRERNVLCQQAGVRMSVLTKSGLLTQDPHTAVEMCQSVKGMGITLDPTCYVCDFARHGEWEIVLSHTLHCQLRDATPSEGQVSCGLGDVDFNRIASSLQNLGFNRTLSVDLLPKTMIGEQRLLELRKLRLLFESML